MVNLNLSAVVLCLFLATCASESNTTCIIEDTIATCTTHEDLKSLDSPQNITKLVLKADLKRINKDDFTPFLNLEEVDLSNAELEEIDDDVFSGLSKLHKINLAGNTKLNTSNIASNSLTCLNLSNTVIDELGNLLQHVPSLRNLDLSGTHVKDFSPLKQLVNLTKLVVSATNQTKELCTVLSIKEIIEKDENGTETTLSCTITTAAPVAPTSPAPPEIKVTEIVQTTKVNEVTTVATIENKTEVASIENKTEVASIKNETFAHPNFSNGTRRKEATTDETVTKPPKEEKIENPPEVIPNTEKNTTEQTVKIVVTTDSTQYQITPEKPQPKLKTEVETKPEVNPKINKTEKMVQASNENKIALNVEGPDDTILPSTSNTTQSNGVNIVLGIILCVMIVGAIGFGYKYWKNRRSGYTHANTQDHDDDDKELQTIVAHRTDPDQN